MSQFFLIHSPVDEHLVCFSFGYYEQAATNMYVPVFVWAGCESAMVGHVAGVSVT